MYAALNTKHRPNKISLSSTKRQYIIYIRINTMQKCYKKYYKNIKKKDSNTKAK